MARFCSRDHERRVLAHMREICHKSRYSADIDSVEELVSQLIEAGHKPSTVTVSTLRADYLATGLPAC
jgi:hypothetical protein